MEIIETIAKWIPRAARVLYDAFTDDVDTEEIRKRLASPEVILDEEIAMLRRRKKSLKDFIAGG